MLLGHFHAWLVMHHHKHLKIQQCCFSKKEKKKKNSTMLESENNTIASKLKTLQIIIIGKKEKEKKKSPLHYSFTTNTTLNFTPKIDTYSIKNIYKRGKKGSTISQNFVFLIK